jgi:UDP-4-amino-4,6-dideoxy-N-acetyl-beta-L-altrosamine transaminase
MGLEHDNAPGKKVPDGRAARILPYASQWIDEADIQAVVDVLRSDFVTQGPVLERFEPALADTTGAKHAVVVSSGTAALHLACLGLGVAPGKTGITSPITFAASANCILYCGGKLGFTDVDPRSGLMDPGALEAELSRQADLGATPGVVVAVSLAGKPADLPALKRHCDRYGWRMLEDAAHSFGAVYDSEGSVVRSASCRHSDAAILSFHPVKHICTGEGGAILTNDDELAVRVRSLRTHGIVRSADGQKPSWHYEQVELGYHYRMTDMQAALGLSQLRKLPGFLRRRRALARRYAETFSAELFRSAFFSPPAEESHAWHLYVVHFRDSRVRQKAFEFLASAGIRTQIHYIPVYKHPYHKSVVGEIEMKGAETYYAGCLSLPLFPKMTDADQDRVIGALADFVENDER